MNSIERRAQTSTNPSPYQDPTRSPPSSPPHVDHGMDLILRTAVDRPHHEGFIGAPKRPARTGLRPSPYQDPTRSPPSSPPDVDHGMDLILRTAVDQPHPERMIGARKRRARTGTHTSAYQDSKRTLRSSTPDIGHPGTYPRVKRVKTRQNENGSQPPHVERRLEERITNETREADEEKTNREQDQSGLLEEEEGGRSVTARNTMPPEQESDCQKQLKGRDPGSKNHGADVWDVVVRRTSSRPYASLTQSAKTLLRRNGVLQSVDRKRDCFSGGKDWSLYRSGQGTSIHPESSRTRNCLLTCVI
jgi:hypothetical protein